jgi:hypothetical protein
LDPDCRNFRGEARAVPPQIICPLLGDTFSTVDIVYESSDRDADDALQQRLASADFLTDAELLELDEALFHPRE